MRLNILYLLLFIFSGLTVARCQTAADMSLPIKVTTLVSPPEVMFNWPYNSSTLSVHVYRKYKSDTSWGSPLAKLSASDTSYTDTSVLKGEGYEYYFNDSIKSGPTNTTYIYAGVEAAPVHTRGRLILLIDNNYTSPLASEINTQVMDLTGDGWQVIKHTIARALKPDSVKKIIKKDYLTFNNVHAVLILGHIPVPYSGDINPDGHPNHLGAWPCDAYYADMTGVWTDTAVNDTLASRTENQNRPGDGKFDQSMLPAPLVLSVGRVDMYNLPAFGVSDTILMQRYLNKDHLFKQGLIKLDSRGLISDNFGFFSGEAFAQNGWRNFRSLVRTEAAGNYFSDMKTGSYLWSYGCGGGNFTGAGGVGSTSDFVADTLHNAFTMLFGSYFGDWDSQDNFLRAALASPGYILTDCWAGRPNWFFHHMALGEPIGTDVLLSQNNDSTNTKYAPGNYCTQWVHTGFLGDPTLRQQYVIPASGLSVKAINHSTRAHLRWTASTDSTVLGYYIYRSHFLTDSFQLITATYIKDTAFTDSLATNGKNIYMVRAVKLQKDVTGSYYNLALGVFDSTTLTISTTSEAITGTSVIWNLYPNPANTFVSILCVSPIETKGLISIADITGREVWQGAIYPGQRSIGINVATLIPGTYWLSILDNGFARHTPFIIVR